MSTSIPCQRSPSRRKGSKSLHPTPYTLHPTPCTLHPTPYTLHPTPSTLHPTHYTLHPTVGQPTSLGNPSSKAALHRSIPWPRPGERAPVSWRSWARSPCQCQEMRQNPPAWPACRELQRPLVRAPRQRLGATPRTKAGTRWLLPRSHQTSLLFLGGIRKEK